jgi:hypothetical protein
MAGTLPNCAAKTVLASQLPDGTQGNSISYGSKLTRDHHFVVFTSLASNFVPGTGDTNKAADIFIASTPF